MIFHRTTNSIHMNLNDDYVPSKEEIATSELEESSKTSADTCSKTSFRARMPKPKSSKK